MAGILVETLLVCACMKNRPNMEFCFCEKSHVGMVRSSNEDSFCCVPDLGLWVVADGMGGHDGGEVASAVVVSGLVKYIRRGQSLFEAVGSANRYLSEAIFSGIGFDGMGTTVVIFRHDGVKYEVAWVGDSRVYLYRSELNELRQLTNDHSVVQEMIDNGVLSCKDAQTHPQRHVVTRAMRGVGRPGILADVVTGDLLPGSIFLLCSDGLTDAVTDEHIAQILQNNNNIEDMGDALVKAALGSGGQDNVTVQLVNFSAV